MNKSMRILILGTLISSKSVTSHEWDKLPSKLNVADYDVLVLNYASLADPQLADRIDPRLLPSQEQFARWIFGEIGSNNEIVIIGSPNFRFGKTSYLDSTYWLPFVPQFAFEEGETLSVVDTTMTFWFQNVHRWTFEATGEHLRRWQSADFQKYVGLSEREVAPEVEPIAQNRTGSPIAFRLFVAQVDPTARKLDVGDGFNTPIRRRLSNAVIWLPEPTLSSMEEMIRLLLARRYDIEIQQEPPEWIERHKLPHQLPLEEAVASTTIRIEELVNDLEVTKAELLEASKPQRLLYEQGEALELAVLDAFRALGATVILPQAKGVEDGRLIDPFGRKAVIEVKGRTGQLKLDDVKQLYSWVGLVYSPDDWNSTVGILAANIYCKLPPSERVNLFPDNCTEMAQQFKLCLLPTTQIFRALCDLQDGTFDSRTFWDKLMGTAGSCRLPDLN